MKTTLRLTFKSLMGKKVRFMLTSLSVILGVMFTVGVFIFTDSLRSVFGDLSQDIAGHIDLSVRGYQEFGNTLNAPPVDPALAPIIAQIEGIKRADPGIVEFNIGVIKPDGEPVSGANDNAPKIGVNWPSINDDDSDNSGGCKNNNAEDNNDSQTNNDGGDNSKATEDDSINIFIAKDQAGKCLGKKPTRTHEFAINANTFKDNNLVLGPGYSITFPGGTQEGYELVGVFNFADRDEDKSVGTLLTAFDLATAERELNQDAGWDSIDIILEDGSDSAEVEQKIITAVATTGLARVIEPEEEAAQGLPRLIVDSTEEVEPEQPDSFSSISLQDIVGRVDLVVRSYQQRGNVLNLPPVSQNLAPFIAQIDGIKAVDPSIFGLIGDITKSDGGPVFPGNNNIFKIGVNWTGNPDFSQTFLAQGRPPATHQEFAVNTSIFEASNLMLGESYAITFLGGIQSNYELVGVFNYADPVEDKSAGAFVAAFDQATAERDLNQGKGWDTINIILEDTADPAAVRQAIGETLGTTGLARVVEPAEAAAEGLPRLEIVSTEEVVQEQEDGFNTIITIFQTFLLSFAAVILLVSIFVIFNTFTIILGQRIREIGLLRALGATDRQIFSSIFGEALAVGLFSSGAGIAAGLGLAYLLRWISNVANFDIPVETLPLLPRTVIVAFVVGTGVTLVSALVPALRSRRVSPMSALRDDLTIGVRLIKKRVALGSILTVTGLALTVLAIMSDWQQMALLSLVGTLLLALGGKRLAQQINLGHWLVLTQGVAFLLAAVVGGFDTGEQATAMGIGALVVIIGVNLISPVFVPQLMRGIGLPIRKLTQTTGKLSTQNASRTPGRTSTTAAALMIGLALVSTITLVATSLKATFQDVLDETVKSDWFICVGGCSDPSLTFSPQLAEDLRKKESVASVLAFRVDEEAFRIVEEEDEFGRKRLSGTMSLLGTNFHELSDHLKLGEVQGAFENPPANSLAIHDETAEDYGLAPGDPLTLNFASGKEAQFTVVALYEDSRIMGDWAMDIASWDEHLEASQAKDAFVSVLEAPNARVDFAEGEGDPETDVVTDLADVTADYPDVEFQTRKEFNDNQTGQIDQIVIVVNVFLFLALVVAFIGIANTLALSIIERTRELGLLRAVGMKRGQMLMMILWEGVLISVFGGLLGIGMGLVFGSTAVTVIPDEFISTLAIPWRTFVYYLVGAGIAGLVSALLPAWRASRLNVLDAIANE